MPARYERLPNHGADDELEAAFQLGDEDDEELDHDHDQAESERRPLRPRSAPTSAPAHGAPASTSAETTAIPGGYDFERQDYDFPPPGSPPAPSSRALPNNFGNSNGILPGAPATPHPHQPSFLRRAFGSLFPQAYSRLPSGEGSSSRVVGGGTENDGVFANVMAKPQPGRVVHADDGSVHVVPEDTQKELPPSYQEAQADAVPPYWETTIHAPMGLEPGSDMIIDDLPTGNFIIFALNFLISWFFQFVGFFLTYMMHTTHAAKYGSRAGLGLTMIQYGLVSHAQNEATRADGGNGGVPSYKWVNGTIVSATPTTPDDNTLNPDAISDASKDWVSFLFMTLGMFLLLLEFLRRN